MSTKDAGNTTTCSATSSSSSSRCSSSDRDRKKNIQRVVEPSPPKSGNNFFVRASLSLLIAYGFLALVFQGVTVLVPIIIIVKILMFREILRINQRSERRVVRKELPWYLLLVTLLVITAWNLKDPIEATYPNVPFVFSIYRYFWLITFSLYMVGLVGFILSLKRGMYRCQFNQLTWTAMILLFVVGQGSLQITNMMKGIIWFLLPVSCVVHNDIWAYCWGKSFGRTALLKLSPRKTVEGFLGAWLFTMVWGFWFSGFLAKFPFLVCPKKDFISHSDCRMQDLPDAYLYTPSKVELPTWLYPISTFVHSSTSIEVFPVQYNALIIASFTSLLSPFGGFFASGLKRAHKMNDFGDLIPGHGGMTDRMDCQIVTGMFTYVYLTVIFSTSTLKRQCPLTLSKVIECVSSLTIDDQRKVAEHILGYDVGGKYIS
eukprot:Tbor_TRINITY_DN5515_c1_g2::TRINITY_DN5515_c1_g2_i1::g.13410::m.13410/K00981/E2.7.7.41, CDS1, CDS2, cdsA; phosphatidate cytidylyltransferase